MHLCWSGWCVYLEVGYVLKNYKAELEGIERVMWEFKDWDETSYTNNILSVP